MKEIKKVFSNAFYLFSDWVVMSLGSLIFSIILWKSLKPDQYGIVLTTINVAVLLSSISLFGLGSVLPKLIPEYFARKQLKKVKGLILFSFKIVTISSLSISAFLFIFSPYISTQLKITEKTLFTAIICLIVISFSNVASAVVYGFQNLKKYFLTDILGASLKVIITLTLLFLGLNYFGPIIGVLIGFLATFIMRFDFDWVKNNSKLIDKKEIINIYMLPALIGVFSILILNNASYIILTAIKDPSITGKFGLAYVLTSQIFIFSSIFSSAIYPVASQLSVDKKSRQKLSNLITLILRYVVFIVFPLSAFMTGFSKSIVILFSTSEYLQAAGLFQVLATASIFRVFGDIFISSLYAIGKTKLSRNIYILNAIIFLSISIPLTYLYSSLGLSFTYIISTLFMTITSYFFLRKSISITFPWKPLFKVLIATLAFLAMLYLIDLIPTATIFKIIPVGVSAIGYLLLLLPLRFYKKQDIKTLEMISTYLPEKLRPIMKIPVKAISKFI
jgi:O-antigen/teichoic acid export membrane protein